VKIHIPNSAFLGNLDPFLKGFDPADSNSLHITLNPKWTSVHPLVLSMIGSLGLTVKSENIHIDKLMAKSSHYLVRMGLYKLLNISCGTAIQEHAPEG